MDVEGPVAALAELTVADDVDPRIGLLAHYRLNRLLQAGLVGRSVVRFAILDLVQERDQLRRPNQASDMRGKDALGGGRHFAPPVFAFVSPYHLRGFAGSRDGAPIKIPS